MDKVSKKHLKRNLTWAAMALVVLLLAIMPLLARTEAEADGPVASVLSATVDRGSIGTSLRGGGTLKAAEEESVKLPSGVKIERFLVKNGDFVTEGTPVAQVDKVSVMTAVTEVNETLKYLREELEEGRNEKVSSSITATAGGRVKKIFAQEGDSVQEVMLQDGALAVLSIDGLMAVKLEQPTGLSTGEAVTVTLENGEETEGRVESNLNGVLIITVEDDGYDVGQTVTVTTEDGQPLGQGNLYIHNAWKATAYAGTIQNVNVKEERTVSSGSTLFTLTDREFEGQLQHRASQHRQYEELLQDLLEMYNTGVLTAPCDGEVSGVDEDSAYLLAAAPEGWELAPLTNTVSKSTERSWTVMLLSGGSLCSYDAHCTLTWEEHEQNNLSTDCPALCQLCQSQNKNHKDTCITRCSKASDPTQCSAINHYDECIWSCTHAKEEGQCSGTQNHHLTCIYACKESDGTSDCPATGAHKTNCIESCIHASVAGVCGQRPHHYIDCIEKCAGDETCVASKHKPGCFFANLTFTAVAAKVVDAGTTELVVFFDTTSIYTPVQSGSGWTVPGGVNEKLMITSGTQPVANPKQFSKGDIILIITGTQGNDVKWSNVVLYRKGTPSYDMSDLLSGMKGFGKLDISSMLGGFSGFGNYGYVSGEEDEGLFDLEGNTLLTVSARHEAKLSIALDEHDIAKVSTGMPAAITVEALKDRTFDAQITKVSRMGTSSGGSSKFQVELTFPMDPDMISGFSATAIIPLGTRENVLRLPVEALDQIGSKTVVYTALDEKTGLPANPVEVVTGVSDGVHVEIVSGLEEGQTVHYTYYDTYEMDHSAEAEKYSFG